jgi:hypothetical protein
MSAFMSLFHSVLYIAKSSFGRSSCCSQAALHRTCMLLCVTVTQCVWQPRHLTSYEQEVRVGVLRGAWPAEGCQLLNISSSSCCIASIGMTWKRTCIAQQMLQLALSSVTWVSRRSYSGAISSLLMSCPDIHTGAMTLGLTQPLAEMSTKNLPGV